MNWRNTYWYNDQKSNTSYIPMTPSVRFHTLPHRLVCVQSGFWLLWLEWSPFYNLSIAKILAKENLSSFFGPPCTHESTICIKLPKLFINLRKLFTKLQKPFTKLRNFFTKLRNIAQSCKKSHKVAKSFTKLRKLFKKLRKIARSVPLQKLWLYEPGNDF